MGTIDPRARFSGAAAGYARHRPSYPSAIVDGILATAGVGPGDVIADVGCGTGILTRLLAERGQDVVGIDPNESMRGSRHYRLDTISYWSDTEMSEVVVTGAPSRARVIPCAS